MEPTPQAPVTETPSSPAPVASPNNTPTPSQNTPAPTPAQEPRSGLDFIPEAFKSEGWATKYKTPEDFFKGVSHMNKMMGQKQIVEGIRPPSQESPPEEWESFFNQIGRPESPEKYQLPEDIQAAEGIDLVTEKQAFTALAHKNGLTQKQAEGLFKDYVSNLNESFSKSQEATTQNFEQALKEAFPEDPQAGLAAAKRAAKALNLGNKLDEAKLSTNPLVLQLCAKLGEFVGEDSFLKGNQPDMKEGLMEEALRIQKSPEYQRGDKEAYRKVQGIYQKVYG